MITEITLTFAPGQENDSNLIRRRLSAELRLASGRIQGWRVLKQSVDARRNPVKLHLRLKVWVDEAMPANDGPVVPSWGDVRGRPAVAVAGSGPAGLFAALMLIERGFRPIVLERGPDTARRKRDIARISTDQVLDSESNYCFGEGGAGTFSDGKLYTRSNKRGDIGRILAILHAHGADPAILTDAHPHIGTDRLPGVINRIRATIEASGGELRFGARVADLVIDNGRCSGVVLASGETVPAQAVVLATGHSARDVYVLLARRGLALESKTWAMGLRVEHSRALIDAIQYHGDPRAASLPAASYSLTAQADGRGVYSFCMCPGGVVVPSATAPDEIVVNGMSAAGRNTRWSNAAIVCEIRPEDLAEPAWTAWLAETAARLGPDPLLPADTALPAGLHCQRLLERAAAQAGDGQRAPAQRLVDFLAGRPSTELPESSYTPGLVPSRLDLWLPPPLVERLRSGFASFGRSMAGFVGPEALLIGVESRTSTPARIPRDPVTLQHPGLAGLFPCGEGSGYAGGIVSSAMDGERVAATLADWLAR